jgi:vesicle-associated membrane protein 7
MYTKLPEPRLLYACIATSQINVECSLLEGNFAKVAEEVSLSLHPETSRSLNYEDKYHIHCSNASKTNFLVICESSFPKRIAYDFLHDVIERYFADSYDFKAKLKERLSYFNTLPAQDKILALQKSVQQVNDIMLENIEQVIRRGTKLNVLADKAEGMQLNARLFQKEAVKVESYFCRQEFMWRAALIGVIGLIVLIVLYKIYRFL